MGADGEDGGHRHDPNDSGDDSDGHADGKGEDNHGSDGPYSRGLNKLQLFGPIFLVNVSC